MYKNQIAKFEAELAQIKQDHGINVIKWQDVPKPSLKLKGYKACIVLPDGVTSQFDPLHWNDLRSFPV